MIKFFARNRTSVRVAFVLRMLTMAANAVLSFFLTRWLLGAMHEELYGIFLTFISVSRLGGLGDLGMGGAVAIRAGQLIGQKKSDELRNFLASARALFLVLGIAVFAVFLALSPWMPHWLRFAPIPAAGSLQLLFAEGAAGAALVIFCSYVMNLNYAHGTVTWPILPIFLITQLGQLGQLLLAMRGARLWEQNIPQLLSAFGVLLVAWMILKMSHPWLGELRPLKFDWSIWRSLAVSSGWVYLCSLGNLIYTTTDQVLVNAGFGPGRVPAYRFNYKIPELATTLILTASYVGLPKLTQWVASSGTQQRHRALEGLQRLAAFQIFGGCAAALLYLAINDTFIQLWIGAENRVSLWLQAAFALNLAVTTAGDAAIQLAGRCGRSGLKIAGLSIGGTSLLNLALSYLAMKSGSLAGIALATVIAQTALSLILGLHLCRHLHLSWKHWSLQTCALPLAITGIAIALRIGLPPHSILQAAALGLSYATILFFAARLAGLKKEMLLAEVAALRSMFRKS